LVICLE